jgi:hypothetical protein
MAASTRFISLALGGVLTILWLTICGSAQEQADGPLPPSYSGSGNLPSDAGQVWREYDIRPYVDRVRGIDNPQQTIVDWILRDTGTGTWFGQPFGLFSASQESIRVYHTPEVQSAVAAIIERFVRPDESKAAGVGVRLITVGDPNWRNLAMSMLRPVSVRTPGLDAWLISRESTTVLLSQLKARVDFREHNSASVTILNGQSHTISRFTPRTFARAIRPTPTAYPGYQIQSGEVREGFALTISPLITIDGANMEAVVKCHSHLVEKMTPVPIDLAAPAKGQVVIEVPQMTSWAIHERFRWPIDDVLLISRGVAMPGVKRPGFENLPALLAAGPPRADALLFVFGRHATDGGRQADAEPARAASRLNYHGRY